MSKRFIISLLFYSNIILLTPSVSLANGPCQACYIQRASYSVQCYVSTHLATWYSGWCTKVYSQAELLHDYASICDKAIMQGDLSYSKKNLSSKVKKIDPCKLCIDLVALTATACIDGYIKPHARCKVARKCNSYLWSTYKVWPYSVVDDN